MNKIILSFSLLIASLFASAQTSVQGGIYNNTTWTLANSPYILTGSVVVFPGKTLTIEPGVEVRVTADNTFNTGNMLYLEVRGTLVAEGTLNSPIKFTSTQANPSSYNWLGIKILGSQGGTFSMDNFALTNSFNGLNNDVAEVGVTHTFNNCIFKDNNYGVQLNANNVYNYCTFQRNGIGQAAQYVYGSLTASNCIYNDNICAFTWVYSPVNVTNCIFNGNTNTINGVSGNLTNCIFENNGNGLYGCSDLVIDNCTFANNDIAINELSYGMVKNSYFTGNDLALLITQNTSVIDNVIDQNVIGIRVNGTNPNSTFINNNSICFNTQYNIENGTNQNFSMALNCFCSGDSTVVEDLILDGYDNITRGLVNYALYDDSCIVMQAFIQKINLGENYNLSTELVDQDDFKLSQFGDELELHSVLAKQVKLFDLTGKELMQTRIENGIGKLNSRSLSAGIYVLQTEKGQSIKWLKH
jgi:hypothetical protein